MLFVLAAILAVCGIYLVAGGSAMINLGRGEQMPGERLAGCTRAVGALLVIVAMGVAIMTFVNR